MTAQTVPVRDVGGRLGETHRRVVPGWWAAASAVYRGQLSRARAARGPLLIVATLQSVGILVLLRGIVHHTRDLTGATIVSGATVLVVAFVALNLLAQRFGALRASHGLDYYAALPVPPATVVLGTAAGYATFTLPGAALTAVIGAQLYGLRLVNLWFVLPAALAAGAALAGLGGLLGLALRRAELATLAGQLGMTLVLFAGVIPPSRLPVALQVLRALVPSTYAVDALSASFAPHPAWGGICWHLAVCLAVAVVALALATRAFRRAVAG